MNEDELMLTIVNTITEYELSKYRQEKNDEYDKINKELLEFSKQKQQVLLDIDLSQAEIIDSYIAKMSAIADMDCRYLYVQGAKDCIKLMKELGAL